MFIQRQADPPRRNRLRTQIAQGGALILGAQAGEARLRDVFEQVGFSSFRRAAETPFNIIYEAKL